MKKICMLLAVCVMALCFTLSSFVAERVVFVAEGGTGDGTSSNRAVGTLTEGYNALGDGGGTIVICGNYTISERFIEPAHSGKVVVTSNYGGTSYNGVIEFYNNYYLTGNTEFNNITLRACTANPETTSPYNGIFGRANDLLLGDGIVSELGDGCATYLSVIGGSSAVYKDVTSNITINSGIWQRLRGGSNKGGSEDYNVNLTINGGTFRERVVLASAAAGAASSHSGNIAAVINDGELLGGVTLTAHYTDADIYSGNSTLTINGGTIYNFIKTDFYGKGTHSGSFDVVLCGGEYSHLLEIDAGVVNADGFETSLQFDEDTDIEALEDGKITFTNYLRRNNADPFMFFYDDYYYYTATGATAVSLIRTKNISDVKTFSATAILTPEDYTDLWSPEIHYFSAEEIGEENAGWYLFVGAKEKGAEGSIASGQRQYVAKCLDGDNLLGRWGDPVTGEVNKLRKMTFVNGGYNDDELCGGSSPIRINGEVYLTFVSEEGRGTSEFHQTVNITTFENPWTITGTPVEICRPDYDWEKHGYWHGTNEEGEDTWWPQVVEGASAVYAPTGEVYLMYTGSGYWTTWYALGYLKFLGGDPMNKANWQKNPDPILQRVETLVEDSVNGCGHGSYFTDRDGQMWVAYHGYIGVDTSSKRFSFVEPIYVTAEGVSIGNGTGNPAPLDTVYEINESPDAVVTKAKGFNSLFALADSHFETGVTVRFSPVENADSYTVYRDDEETVVYEGSDYRFTDANAPVGSHTYIINAMQGENVLTSKDVVAYATNLLEYKDLNGDGRMDVADVAFLLRGILNNTFEGASFLDAIRLLKAVVR